MPGERRWAILNLVIMFTAVGMWLVYFTVFEGTAVNQALFEFATVLDFASFLLIGKKKLRKIVRWRIIC